MATTPKYDNDYVTLGYLNDTLDTETKETEKKIGTIPKNYNSPPVPPYYVNSLLLLNGQIYKCIKSRLVGSFNISDWQVVVSTNEIDEALKTIFDVNKLEYVEQEDGIIETFYQNSDPSLEWETDIEKNNHVSDLWTIDTLTCYQYVKNATNPVTYCWKRRTVPSTLFDVFDGYKKIYLQEPTNYSKDDLWFGETTKVALESSEEFNPEHWEERDDFVESSIIQQEEYHVVYLLPKIIEINRQSIAEIKKAIDTITLTVSQTYTTKTEVEKYVDGVKTDIAEEYITKEESTAQLEITAKSISGVVEENVERIDGEINEQNQKISQTMQTVDELNSKIKDIADITTSAEDTDAKIEINEVNQSEPIRLVVRPIGESISNLLISSNMLISDKFKLKQRIIRFTNVNTNEIFDYELPDDLIYHDSENYDEFILDYDGQSCVINKKVGYNADGTTYILENPTTIEYVYPTGNKAIVLTDGNYKIEILGYDTGYIFARLMAKNIYTTQFYTKAEVDSNISQTANTITSDIDAKLKNYSTTKEMNNTITQSVTDVENSIKSEISNTYTTKEETTEFNNTIEQKITDELNKINLEVNKKANTSDVNAKLELKVDTNNLISKINASADAINLKGNRVTIESDNFNLDADGTMTATAGNIGGYKLSNNNLSAFIKPNYNYTSIDPQTILDYYLGTITLTDEEKKCLDYNNDGVVDMFDATAILNLVNNSITKDNPGQFLINANDAYYNIAILDGNGNIKTQIGLAGITTNKLSSPEIDELKQEIETLKQEIEVLKNA